MAADEGDGLENPYFPAPFAPCGFGAIAGGATSEHTFASPNIAAAGSLALEPQARSQ